MYYAHKVLWSTNPMVTTPLPVEKNREGGGDLWPATNNGLANFCGTLSMMADIVVPVLERLWH